MPTRARPDGKPEYYYDIKLTAGHIRQLYKQMEGKPDEARIHVATVRIPDWVKIQCPGNKRAQHQCDKRDQYDRQDFQPFNKVGLRQTKGTETATDRATGMPFWPVVEIREQPMCKACRFA